MNLRGNIVSVLMAGSLAAGTVFPAMGAGPGVTEVPNRGYDDTTWQSLNDNKIEYDELETLIKEFNPNMVSGNMMFQDNIDYLNFASSDSKDASRKIKEEAEQLMQTGNMADPGTVEVYTQLMTSAAMYQYMGTQFNKNVKNMEKVNASATKELRNAEKMLTNGAKSVMIGYNTVNAQITMVEKTTELSSAMHQSTLLQQQLGMATQSDVLSAETNLLAAKSQLQSLKNTRDSLHQQLGLLTGWSADAAFEIGPIPAVDMQWIADRNQEEDIVNALGNNGTLVGERHQKTNSSAAASNKQSLEGDAEQKIRIEMQSLYQEMLKNKAAYESAGTAYQSALISKNGADRQYNLGMTSKIQNLGQQFTFLQAEGAYKAAELNLASAILAYQQGIDGFITIE